MHWTRNDVKNDISRIITNKIMYYPKACSLTKRKLYFLSVIVHIYEKYLSILICIIARCTGL